jgi:hypothetical protein
MKRKACPGPAPRSSPRRRPKQPAAHTTSAPVAAITSTTGADEEDASRTGSSSSSSSSITTMNVAAAHDAAANIHDDAGDVIEIVPPERGSGGAAETAASAPVGGGAAVPLLVKDSSVPAPPAPICYEVYDDDEDAMEYEYDDEDYEYAFDAAGGREIPGPSVVDDRKMPALTRTFFGAAGKGTANVSDQTAAAATSTATATTSAPNFFDLCNDDDDGGGLRYGDKYFDWNNDGFLSEEMKFGSGPWAGADPMTSPLPPAFDAASQPFGTAFAAFAALPKLNGPNRGARRNPVPRAAEKSGGTEPDDGVIDLEKDEDESTNKDDEAAVARQYRRILGPLRFDFCEELPHHDATSGYRAVPHGPFASAALSSSSKATKAPAHNAASASAATSRTKTNLSKLAKELVELKLNLPVELSSSIFVRAKEGDMSLIRALITGTLRACVAGFSMRRNCCLFAP